MEYLIVVHGNAVCLRMRPAMSPCEPRPPNRLAVSTPSSDPWGAD